MKTLEHKRFGECCWPLGRDADGWRLFCCEPVARGSYCAAHFAASRRETKTFAPARVKEMADFFGGGTARVPGAGSPGGPRDVVSVMSSRLNARGGR